MTEAFEPSSYTNLFRPIGVVAGSGPEAGVDLWSKILLASRMIQGSKYAGDFSAPLVRVISDPALGLPLNRETEPVITSHLRKAIDEISRCSGVFTIACNALQARAREILSSESAATFISFDQAIDSALSQRDIKSFFLLGASVIMGLTEHSIYAPLKLRYDIRTPTNWDAVDALIADIKISGGKASDLPKRLEQFIAEAQPLPVVLACTDFPLVPVDLSHYGVIDATDALAMRLVRTAARDTSV